MKTRVLICLCASWATAGLGSPPTATQSTPLPPQLDLRSAILYALDHNYAILQAREQIRQEEGVILQVKAPSVPNVNANGQYQRNQPSISQSFPQSDSSYVAQVRASQVLYAGGGLSASIRQAEYNRDAALFNLQATIDAALLDVRSRFYSVLLAREKVGVEEENIRLLQRQLEDAQNQFHAGATSNFEVLRARVAIANAQPALITARNDYRIALEQLRQSLGVPSGRGAPIALPPVSGSLDVSPATYDLEAALEAAREHRPELLRLAKLKDAGEAGVTNARSGYYPNLSLFGGYQWDGFGFSGGGSPSAIGSSANAHGWVFGLQSSWAIFDGRATTGRVRQARSLLEQNRLSESSEQLSVDVEVRQAFSSFDEARELVDASQKTVEQAVEAEREANERYHAGSATQLDVLTSQVALTQARTNQLQANYNYLVALAALRKAMGLTDALVGG